MTPGADGDDGRGQGGININMFFNKMKINQGCRYKITIRELKQNGMGFTQVYSETIEKHLDKYFLTKLEVLNGAPVLIGLDYRNG